MNTRETRDIRGLAVMVLAIAFALIATSTLSASAASALPETVSTTETTASATNITVNITIRSESPGLEPGVTKLHLHLAKEGAPLANTAVKIALDGRRRTLLQTRAITDGNGDIPLTFFFDVPGTYTLRAAIQESDGTILQATAPIIIHGQAVLIIGFFTAITVVFVILTTRN